MKREVSVRGYSPVTAGQIMRFAAALDADGKPWVQAYAYMVGASRRGDTLNQLEANWLDSWLTDSGECREPRDVIVSQVGVAELTEELFGGQRQIAQRALRKLADVGLVTLVAKGKPGHSSLYVLGIIEWGRDTKTCENVSDADVENLGSWDTNKACMGYEKQALGYKKDDLGYKQGAVTCENAPASIVNQSTYQKDNQERAPRGKSQGGDFHALRCRHCGSVNMTRNTFGMHECRDCGGVTKFRATA